MNSSTESTEELFREYIITRDVCLRNEIISNNLFLAQSLSRKFLGRGTEYDDLYQIASLALIKAVERYDPDFETKFITFATPTIIGEIKKYFRDKAPIIKLPRRIHEAKAKIAEAKNELQASLGRVPSAEDIALYLETSVETILEAMEANLNTFASSIDAGTLFDEDSDHHELFGADDVNYTVFENRALVEMILNKLDEFEKKFIEMRFFNEMTQSSVAMELSVSQMYISRLEKKIIDKMKKLIET